MANQAGKNASNCDRMKGGKREGGRVWAGGWRKQLHMAMRWQYANELTRNRSVNPRRLSKESPRFQEILPPKYDFPENTRSGAHANQVLIVPLFNIKPTCLLS